MALAYQMKPFSDTIWQPGQPLRPTDKALGSQELTDRLMYLEKLIANPSLDQINVAALKTSLEQTWLPDPSTLFAGGTVGPETLGTTPHVHLTRAANQAIANAAFTVAEDVVWTAAQEANTSMWTAGTGIVAPMAGVYVVSADITFAAGGAASDRLVGILVNGVYLARNNVMPGTAAIPCVTRAFRLTRGSTVTIRAYQTSGAPLNIAGCYVSMTMVGGA